MEITPKTQSSFLLTVVLDKLLPSLSFNPTIYKMKGLEDKSPRTPPGLMVSCLHFHQFFFFFEKFQVYRLKVTSIYSSLRFTNCQHFAEFALTFFLCCYQSINHLSIHIQRKYRRKKCMFLLSVIKSFKLCCRHS